MALNSSIVFTVLCLICTVHLSAGIKSEYRLYEDLGQAGQHVTLFRNTEDITGVVNRTLSYAFRGMWTVRDKASGIRSSGSYYTQDRDDVGEGFFNSDHQNIFDVKVLGAQDTSIQAISLYEDRGNGYGPFPIEHHFTANSWSGIRFPIRSLATTGWSNWTLYEGSGYTGYTVCLRSNQEYHWVDSLDGSYPTVVGSLLKGCTTRVKTLSVDLPSMTQQMTAW